MHLQELDFLVAVPLPTRTRRHGKVAARSLRACQDELLRKFTEWFGGATALPGAGTWTMLDGSGLAIDRDQVVVVSMTTEARFRDVRDELAKLVEDLGVRLEQEGMAVLAFPRNAGFLVFPDGDRKAGA